MDIITKRLSGPELTQHILDMAKTGVYRESVLEALQPLATKRQISQAIAQAKRFGLHSVASLRDAELGTYYQLDLAQYQARQHLLKSEAHLGSDADLVQRVTVATEAVQSMLAIAQTLAAVLATASVVAALNHWRPLSLVLLSSSASAVGIWLVQKSLVKKLP
jgi:hypothetical protein